MEKGLIINEKDAIEIYPTSGTLLKGWLSECFGETTFLNAKPKVRTGKITDRIKTFEDACEELGLDSSTVLPFLNPSGPRQEAAQAFAMLDIIAEALRGDAILDWTNENQKKWYPYFNNYSSGSGWSFGASHYGWSNSDASGGARLCVESQETANYFGRQFLSIWNKFLNPNK